MFPGERRMMQVYIGKMEMMLVRLVIEKLPTHIASSARRKLKKYGEDKSKFISKKRLALCDVNTYITNTTPSQIPNYELRDYYSLRWQIELIFKAWKSVYKIDCCKNMKMERFECMIYGTLIFIIITTHLLTHFKRTLHRKFNKELSELKFYKILKQNINQIKIAFIKSNKHILKALSILEALVFKSCIKQPKYYGKTPYSILNLFS